MKPPRHILNYLSHFGYSTIDWIACECGCGRQGTDFHHLTPRSSFGSSRKKLQDQVENIICISRECHSKAHSDREFNEELKRLHFKNLLGVKRDNETVKYIPEPQKGTNPLKP